MSQLVTSFTKLIIVVYPRIKWDNRNNENHVSYKIDFFERERDKLASSQAYPRPNRQRLGFSIFPELSSI